MDDLRAKIVAFLRQPWPNRRLVALICGLVAVIAVVVSLPSNNSTAIESNGSPSKSSSVESIALPSFFVHIVGYVKNPGVYSLPVGARMFDAVFAAGGFLPGADQASVNLARQLTDGEQVDVLKVGAQPSSSSSSPISQLVSINRADEQTLESLPGVGPALAGRIIDWRVANGGFKKKEELLNVGGIGDKLFGGLSKLITL